MKKLWIGLIAAGLVAAISVPIIVGVNKNNNKTEQEKVYAAYVVYAEAAGDKALSYEDWLKTIKGEKGDKGDAGAQGSQGEKGEKGDKGDKGEAGENGQNGKSAYEIWLENGNSGTEADFLEWLKGQQGEKGDKGDKGDPGSKGDRGEAGRGIASMEINDNGELIITYTDGTTENLGVIGGQKRYIVRVYYVGDELWAEYSDGISEKISVDSSACKHENAVYKEQVAHTRNADGTFTNGIYLMMCPDCQLSKTISDVRHAFVDVVIDPDCTEDGYTYKECAVCCYETDKEKTADALGHNYDIRPSKSGSEASDWCMNGGETDKYCTRCNEVIETFELEPYEALGHVSDKWELVSPPSYYTNGTISGKCKYCGTDANKMIPVLSDEAYTVSDILPEGAVCSQVRTGTFTITIDGQEIAITNVTMPGTLHTLNGETVDDTDTFIFKNKAELNASGFELMGNSVAFSCDAISKASFTCDVCKNEISVTVRKAHEVADGSEITTITPATCETGGVVEFDCKTCDQIVRESIPALGHDLQYAFVQGIEGTSLYVECKRKYGYNYVYTNLREVLETIVRPATCTEEGCVQYAIITADGSRFVINIVTPKTNHMTASGNCYETEPAPYTDPDVFLYGNVTTPTCTHPVAGYFICAGCNQKIEVLVKGPHSKPDTIDEENIKAPTCTEYGWIKYDCTWCEEKDIMEYTEPTGHKLTVEVKDGMVVITCKTENCPLNLNPYTEELKPLDYKVDGKDYYTLIESVPATSESEGYNRYSFTFTFFYDVTIMKDDKEVSETKEVEFKDLTRIATFLRI